MKSLPTDYFSFLDIQLPHRPVIPVTCFNLDNSTSNLEIRILNLIFLTS